MLTEFGKLLRKIRIDRQELLKEMAEKLMVSSAYLSAVENGKRRIPSEWIDQISRLYQLNSVNRNELDQAAEMSADEIRISLQDASLVRRDAVLTFAKALDDLSDEELRKIMSAVKKRDDGKDGRHLA